MIETGTAFAIMAKSGITALTSELIKRVLNNWGSLNLSGRKAVRYLGSQQGFLNYLEKHVSVVLRMRTIHSNEYDVLLQDIYHPLSVKDKGNSKYDFDGVDIYIDDDFTSFSNSFVNIIGIAGQGKSTILRKIFNQYMKFGDKLPVFIELRRVEDIGLIQGISRIFTNIGMDSSEEIIREILRQDKVVLFLDGFDEVSASKRKKILEETAELNSAYNTKIISTSRPETEICHAINIKNYTVNRLVKSDIVGIIRKLKIHSPHTVNEDAENIINKLDSETKLVDVMVSPILVTLFYISYPYMDLIPKNDIEFYDNIFNILYIRHDKLKNYTRDKQSSLTHKEANRAFCAFSFISFQKNQITMSYEEMIDNTEKAIKNIGIDSPEKHNPEHLCDDFINVTCLLQNDGLKYSFLHKSICEFHAASFIKNTSLDLKRKFYNNMMDKLISNDAAIMNTVFFLKQMDDHDFTKYFSMPLFDKLGINHWGNPNNDLVDSYINDVIFNSIAHFHIENDSIELTGIDFASTNTWVNIFSGSELWEDLDVVEHVIDQVIMHTDDFNYLASEYDRPVSLRVDKLLNEKRQNEIREKIRPAMINFYNKVYITTQNRLNTTEASMLSLLDL